MIPLSAPGSPERLPSSPSPSQDLLIRRIRFTCYATREACLATSHAQGPAPWPLMADCRRPEILRGRGRGRERGRGQRPSPASSGFHPLHLRTLWLIPEFSTPKQLPPNPSPLDSCWTFSLVVSSGSETTGNADFIRVLSANSPNCCCPLAGILPLSMLRGIPRTPHPALLSSFILLLLLLSPPFV